MRIARLCLAATAFLVFISAFGGHEFKWREVTIIYVILIIFSVLVFVNDEDIRFLENERTPLRDGDEISIVPAFAGG